MEWAPLRGAEQVLSRVFAISDGLLGGLLPEPALPDQERRVDDLWVAQQAHGAWLNALTTGARPTDERRELVLAPVLEVLDSRKELIVGVAPGSVQADTPVTHQGVLLGFVRPWRRGDPAVEVAGRARVALLGHGQARPVAAVWKASEASDAVHFVLRTRERAPTLVHSSLDLDPPQGQLAWTRDVSLLGDDLPPGLLLGRLTHRDAGQGDQPGGGVASPDRERGPDILEPVLDPNQLGYVVLEASVGSAQDCRRSVGHLMHSGSRLGRLRLDIGAWQGVQAGDLVVQDGVLVGVVQTAGPWSSIVHRGLPPGKLLVVDENGEVVPTGLEVADWPADWRPTVGQPVLSGHRELGGLLVGSVDSVGPDGFGLRVPLIDGELPVTVIER